MEKQKWQSAHFKQLLKKKNEDPALALLQYLATPGPCRYSPAELMMERKIRTRTPTLLQELRPKNINQKNFGKKIKIIEPNRHINLIGNTGHSSLFRYDWDQEYIILLTERRRNSQIEGDPKIVCD